MSTNHLINMAESGDAISAATLAAQDIKLPNETTAISSNRAADHDSSDDDDSSSSYYGIHENLIYVI